MQPAKGKRIPPAAFDSKVPDLDARDWAILKALQQNARTPFAELARTVRLTAPAVAERVRRLEDAGVIRGYRADVHLPNAGRGLQVYFRVFVAPREYPRLLRMVEKLPEVLECHHVTGAESFIVRAAVCDVHHLEQLIQRMTAFGETTTSVVLSTAIHSKLIGPDTGAGG